MAVLATYSLAMVAGFLLGAAPLPQGGAPGLLDRELVVRQAFLATRPTVDYYTFWDGAGHLGDIDRDGMQEFFLSSMTVAQGGVSADPTYHYRYFSKPGGKFVSHLHQSGTPRFSFSSGWTPNHCVLRFPGAHAWMAPEWPSFDLMAWEVQTKQYLGSVPVDTRGVFWAGDVNFDGFDDAFFHTSSGSAVSGLIDGRTMSIAWAKATDPNMNYPSTPSWVGGGIRPDIDGDGRPDFINAFTLYNSGNSFYEHMYRAFSGRTGNQIWSLYDSLQGVALMRRSAWGPDINLDGFPDIVSLSKDYFLAVDAKTGTFLLQVSNRIMNDVFPSPQFTYDFTYPISRTGKLGDPAGEEIVCRVQVMDNTAWPYPRSWELVYLDPATLQRLDHIPFPDDLMPWSPDLVGDPNHSHPDRNWSLDLGDIDRDGFFEIARVSHAYQLTGAYASQNLSIIGQRTLFVPDQVQIGTSADFTVSIPSSPGRSFYTLVSTAFDGEQGVLLANRWPTFLAPSYSLTQTLGGQSYRGTLDAAGEATVSVPIPPAQNLVGQTIYSRVVIEEPGEPGDIWTLSSLGVTEIVP